MPNVKLSRTEVIRAQHLLNMRYAPSELAEEIGCKVDSVYKMLIPAGCPHERDDGGRLWILGAQFREWARANATSSRTSRTKDKMPEGQGYCFKCRRRVEMKEGTVRPTNRYLELVTGTCSLCGGIVNRAQRRTDNGK